MLKKCIKCDNEFEETKNKKVCNKCIQLKMKKDKHNYYVLNRESNNETLIRATDNFISVTKNNGFTLTTKGFNQVSELKVHGYIRIFKRIFNKTFNWFEIVKYFRKENELYNYIVDEVKRYIAENNSKDLSGMTRKHPYIAYELMQLIGLDEIRESVNITKSSYSVSDYKNSFLELVRDLKRIPLFKEFCDTSKISWNSYRERFKLSGNVYDSIVKMFVHNQELLLEYEENKLKDKTKRIKNHAEIMSSKITFEDLKENFIYTFEYCLKEYGVSPTRKYFNKISKYDSLTYSRKLEIKSWNRICKHYGYKVNKEANIAEKLVLGLISKITGCKYEPQQDFDWLRGVNNFPLSCDGFYEEIKLIVEYDGPQHRRAISKFGGEKTFITQQQNDKLKDKLVKEHGYIMLRISSEDPWYDTTFIINLLIENNIPVLQEYSQSAS